MSDETAEVVPRGEREDLQRTAQATGERMGRQDTRIEGHDDHFVRLNGSLARIDATLHDMAVAQAVQTASIASIQRTNVERDEQNARRVGWSVQVWCCLVAAGLTMLGMGVAIFLCLVGILASLLLGT